MRSTVDWATKGLWLPQTDRLADADLVAGRRRVFDPPFTWPVMVAKHSAIAKNIATMAAYCARHEVRLAPHGKTTMAPTVFAAQLAAGAWGITLATANQALVARRFGVPRVLLANELLDVTALRWAAQEVTLGWDFLCYVDSLAGVAALREALHGSPGRPVPAGRLTVLVEMGFAGGRTGCRTVREAVAVARAAAHVSGVQVAGVAGFEGMLPDEAAVRRFLATMVTAAQEIAPMCVRPMILSAGGSTFFDVVVDVFGPPAKQHDWQVVVRSGCYAAHDDGLYATSSPFSEPTAEGSFTAALEVFAQVLSTPEPGLAILGAGKRDLPFDAGMPVPKWARSRDGSTRALPGSSVEGLNDQHAYLRGAEVTPGELVCLGISHPCTAFDKWRVIPVVDDTYQVVDLLHTYF